MTQLKNNSYYKNLSANEHFKGIIDKIPDDFNSIKVSVQTDKAGTLTLYHSIDGISWSSYGDIFTITTDSHKQATLKGKYLYISYLNGPDATTNFNLVSYLSKAIHNNIDVKLTTEDQVSVVPVGGAMDVNVVNSVEIQGLNFNQDGALIVTGGGGGGGGDASASNQEEQITLATTLNDEIAIMRAESQTQTTVQEAINDKIDTRIIKCDTDNVKIDSLVPVHTLGLAKVYNTLNNAFLTTDGDQSLRVNVVNQISNITGYALESTLTNIKTELTNNMPTKAIQIDTAEEVSLIRQQHTPLQHEQGYADILVDGPTMSADSNPPFTYHPTIEGFYYSNTVSGGASNLYFYANTQAKQTQYTINELMNSYAVVTLGSMTATNTLPFLVVYSKPQGAGDHAIWYRSKWVYTIPNTAQLSAIGQQFMIYWGEEPSMKIHPNVHRVQATLTSSAGPALSSEILLYLTVNTESSATINTVKAIYQNVGFTTIGGLIHDTKLGYGKQDKTREITTKIENLNSTVGAGVFVQLDGNVSGLKLKSTLNDGSADVNVKNSFSLESTQQELKAQLDKLTFNNSNELLVASSGGSTGYPDVNLKCNDVLLTQTENGIKKCLDVEVNNMINVDTLATEQTVSEMNATLSKLSFDENNILLVSSNVKAQDIPITYTQTAENKFSLDVNINNISPVLVSGEFYQQTQPVSIEQLSFTGQNELIVYDSNVIKCDTDNIGGSVSVSNMVDVSDLATEATVNTIKEKIDNLSFDLQNNLNTTINNVISVKNETSGALDVHCFGSSDGILFHHLKTNSQGVLSTNAIIETDNGALTSTLVSETETYNALDVKIKGQTTVSLSSAVEVKNVPTETLAISGSVNSTLKTEDNGLLTSTLSGTGNSIHALDVQVKNTSITAIQKSQPASVQTILTNEICNCTGPSDSRALTIAYDTTGFLYASVILNITNYSVSGYGNPNLYLQSSPDGVFWFNESSNSVYQNGPIKIQAYSVLTVPYVRLYLDTSSFTPPNVVQFTIQTALLCQK